MHFVENQLALDMWFLILLASPYDECEDICREIFLATGVVGFCMACMKLTCKLRMHFL
ncbi:hypothetical protein BVRB_3g066740 [Beta vulgaris subsp. vulgaris]|nr:hypothetical protein BVRB_3g066740 [Beta vulgaris subsp. vulgaris]